MSFLNYLTTWFVEYQIKFAYHPSHCLKRGHAKRNECYVLVFDACSPSDISKIILQIQMSVNTEPHNVQIVQFCFGL